MKQEQTRQMYGLMTAVSMIVGVVIGSGIYFKADDILNFTGGNVILALFSLVIASSGIIFGCLSLTELSQNSSISGGVASYFEQFVSPKIAAGIGFFQAFVYFPSVIAIVCWVGAIYTAQLLGVPWSFGQQIVVAFAYITILLGINLVSRRLGGWFQSLSTMVKVIPLLLIAVIGLFWSQGQPLLPAQYDLVSVHDVGLGWLSALVPLAFAYDGWSIVVAISPEIKNPQKNLPRAFVIGPLVVLSLYMLYIYGVTHLLGESYVLSVGDDAVRHVLRLLFGEGIVRLFMLIIVVSILGVANGLLLGTMRLPQAYAERGWLKSQKLAAIHPTFQVSIASTIVTYLVTVFWLGIHYLVTSRKWLVSSDISEIAIVFNALAIGVLYIVVLSLYSQGKISNRLTGLIAPILAFCGSLMILLGSLLSNGWQTVFFLGICLLSFLVGILLYQKNCTEI